MSTNTALVYYRNKIIHSKDLCQHAVNEFIGTCGTDLSSHKINNVLIPDYFSVKQPGHMSFPLTTIYPGLLIGTGYTHPKIEKEDFQFGFYFDHTTGMPVIPGSTVKGVLKSIFPKEKEKDEIKAEKMKYIHEKIGNNVNQTILKTNWQEIFFERKQVFLDAYISDLPRDRKIFAEDYICPHTAGVFREPNPIRFLKIAPGVTFTFQFVLHDYSVNGKTIISAENIMEIFKQIIIDFGIGAKRNVGYGAMV